MDSDIIADLKQFFEATLSQQLAQQKREIMNEAREGFAVIYQRFDEQSEKMDKILNAIRADLAKHSTAPDDHTMRITRLERKTA